MLLIFWLDFDYQNSLWLLDILPDTTLYLPMTRQFHWRNSSGPNRSPVTSASKPSSSCPARPQRPGPRHWVTACCVPTARSCSGKTRWSPLSTSTMTTDWFPPKSWRRSWRGSAPRPSRTRRSGVPARPRTWTRCCCVGTCRWSAGCRAPPPSGTSCADCTRHAADTWHRHPHTSPSCPSWRCPLRHWCRQHTHTLFHSLTTRLDDVNT